MKKLHCNVHTSNVMAVFEPTIFCSEFVGDNHKVRPPPGQVFKVYYKKCTAVL
jgi:hypothetical protein